MVPFSGDTLKAPRVVQENEAVAFPSFVSVMGCRRVDSRLSVGNCLFRSGGGDEGGQCAFLLRVNVYLSASGSFCYHFHRLVFLGEFGSWVYDAQQRRRQVAGQRRF